MNIQKKRINNIEKYLAIVGDAKQIYISFPIDLTRQQDLLVHAGFLPNAANGATILPAEVGPITTFNSEGRDIPLKNLPMETKYRDGVVTDWHGDEHYVDIPYKRYQRDHIEAPMEEISLYVDNGQASVISALIPTDPSQHKRIRHIINMFLELFGQCDILNSNKASIIPATKIKRENWRILPPGPKIWDDVKKLIRRAETSTGNVEKAQKERFEIIKKYNPDEIHSGLGGLDGYLVFVFYKKKLAILENIIYGNAIYVFNGDWKAYSKMTKAEIIHKNLYKKRIIHTKGWKTQLDKLLK